MTKPERVVNVRPSAYRYTLRSAPSYGWRTGTLRDGRQVIVIGPSVVVFDSNGRRCAYGLAADTFPPARRGANWQSALGFTEGPISVKRFRVRARGIFIEDLTWTFGEFVADPNSPRFADCERAEFPKDIEEWVESGLFVFSPGGNDYYVDRDGVVVSS